jgi:hypothetical protein
MHFNRSTTDQIFCIHQMLEKKWEHKETVHQLFIDFKKAYISVTREILYNILTDCGISMKLVQLIKMSLNESYSEVHIKHPSDTFPIQNGWKQGDALSSLLFNFALDHAIRRAKDNKLGLNLNGTHQLPV